MRKLGQKVKTEDKKEVKLEEVPEPLKDDNEPQMSSADIKGKYSLFTEKKEQPMQHLTPAEVFSKDKTAATEKVTVQEEEIQTQQRSPITILSEDEGYLLEEDQSIAKSEARFDSCKEFSTLENKTVRPRRKKNRVEVMEFAAVKHQGRNLRMMGELAPAWRPKTRPTNKLKLNLKKLLNPKLNTKEVTVLDDISPDEEPEIDKMSIKRKKKAVAKTSSFHPAKAKRSLQSVEDSNITQTKLSTVFLELRAELLKQQQEEETEVLYVEGQSLKDEATPKETYTQENPSIPDISTDLLDEDADIFKKLKIPWMPSDAQETIAGKPFDSDKENLQRTIKQYRHQMDYMQEVNDGLIMANRRLREDLQEVNEHYQELTAVTKEALKRKRTTDLHCAELKLTVESLQKQNEELTRRLADMEDEQKRAKKKAQALDGIALLAKAANDL